MKRRSACMDPHWNIHSNELQHREKVAAPSWKQLERIRVTLRLISHQPRLPGGRLGVVRLLCLSFSRRCSSGIPASGFAAVQTRPNIPVAVRGPSGVFHKSLC